MYIVSGACTHISYKQLGLFVCIAHSKHSLQPTGSTYDHAKTHEQLGRAISDDHR